MFFLLIIVLLLIAVGGLPNWPYMANANYGYYPSGITGFIFLILVILLLTGRL